MQYPQFNYEPETDTLNVQLSESPIIDSIEPAIGVIVSLDKDQRPVLIEFMGPVRKWFAPLIEHASKVQSSQRSG